MSLQVAACTHTGVLRTQNEDAFGYCLERGVFVVCDGMGGAAAGEIASHMASETITELLCDEKQEEPRPALDHAFHEANRRIYVRAQRDPSLFGMGTTIVAARVEGNRAWLAHVGDSRCYLLRNGDLKRCTQDHSLVDEQLRLGQITAEEAENSPYRNIITRALGTQSSVAAEHKEFEVKPGDALLLCTDGLTRELSDRRIAELMNDRIEEGLPALCEALVEAANEAGGRDNITCMVVRV